MKLKKGVELLFDDGHFMAHATTTPIKSDALVSMENGPKDP